MEDRKPNIIRRITGPICIRDMLAYGWLFAICTMFGGLFIYLAINEYYVVGEANKGIVIFEAVVCLAFAGLGIERLVSLVRRHRE